MITGNEDFWKKWIEANENEKIKIVAELPILKDIKCPLFSANVINSYFEDLYLYLKKENREPGKNEG